MNDHYIYFIKFKSILNVVETMSKWHDIAQKPKINLFAQCVIYVQGVAGLIEIYIDLEGVSKGHYHEVLG